MARMSQQRQWLNRVNPSITWRLVGPNLKNPFDSTVNESALEGFLSDNSLLMESCTVQAHMDDTEILRITDLTDLKFQTVHPNILDIEREELRLYLEEFGVWEFVNEEFKKLLAQVQDELDNRRGGGSGGEGGGFY